MSDIDYSDYPTVRAYSLAYTAGEAARETGSSPILPLKAINQILDEPGIDEVERQNVLSAAEDGLHMGWAGDEPLDAVQVAVAYD